MKDNALIEFEETVLAASVSKPEDALTQAESVVSTYGLADSAPESAPSPATIILFSRLYNVASTNDLAKYPTLSTWFKKVLDSKWAKIGIEKATTVTGTKEKKQKGKKVVKEEDVSDRVYVTKIKEGINMNIPDPSKKM